MSLINDSLECSKVRNYTPGLLALLVCHKLVEALKQLRLTCEAFIVKWARIGSFFCKVIKSLFQFGELLLAVKDRLETTITPRLQLLLLIVDVHECEGLSSSFIASLCPIQKHSRGYLFIK